METTNRLGLDRFIAGFDRRRLPWYRFDLVVVGSGSGGCSAALAAADRGLSVALLAKCDFNEANTQYAQGGVAAVLHPEDSFESHVQDTMKVGCGLGDAAVIERVVRGGPQAIQALLDLGAEFDRNAKGELDLSREGGHSHHRIVHAGGAATGLAIQRPLVLAVKRHENIACFENTLAIDLVQDRSGEARGVLCRSGRDEPVVFAASQIILATGGSGQLYRETTNPAIATGDGVAMAFRAGALVRNLEFVQFHPTCLYIAGAARVLISEIVRGEGGVLRDKNGTRFMPEYHPAAELAPRDIVSRAAFDRMVKTKDTSVYLDLSDLDRNPHTLFPGISRICKHFGIDIARDPIPVRPGAHYMVGGILVDIDGRTSVPGLWAVGECASTGLHGANRMGSNSLLEALVLGRVAAECAADSIKSYTVSDVDFPARDRERPQDTRLSVEDMIYSLKSLMWRQMGIIRDGPSLEDALKRIAFWMAALRELAPPERRAFELINMLTVARLATISAQARPESRGVHFRSDFPETDRRLQVNTVLVPVCEGAAIEGVRVRHEPTAASVSTS